MPADTSSRIGKEAARIHAALCNGARRCPAWVVVLAAWLLLNGDTATATSGALLPMHFAIFGFAVPRRFWEQIKRHVPRLVSSSWRRLGTTTSGAAGLGATISSYGEKQMSDALLDRYCEEGFKHVDGWGVDRDLIELFIALDEFHALHGVRGTLCEIGVHHGRTLILLGLLKKAGERVVGVDLFEGAQEQNLDGSGSGSYAALVRNTKQHAPGIDFTLIAGNSFNLPATDLAQMNGCRFFHIDGGHYMEVVLNDLALAQTSLGVGGVIVVDDYWHSGFPEVQEAVHRYFLTSSNMKAVPFMVGRNKIFLAHFSHKDRLIDFMSEKLPPERRKRVKVLGHEAICCDVH